MIITIDPKLCEGCQRCCHGTHGNRIPAKPSHGKIPRYNKQHNCDQLNKRQHCNRGIGRPVECAIYPIVIFDDGIYVDMSCPGWQSAVDQWTKRFGAQVDDYQDGRQHEFVNLWIAQARNE